MRDRITALYYGLLMRGVSRFALAFFVFLICGAIFVSLILASLWAIKTLQDGLPEREFTTVMVVAAVLFVAAVFATIFHDTFPDDPRKQKDEESE